MDIFGSCHCRNVTFCLNWPPTTPRIPARACTCSFCVKHGGVWTSSPKATLTVTVRDAALVHRYEFGTRTAQFQVCASCGAVPLVTCEIDGSLYAVVSVNAFEGVDPACIDRSPASFDGEGVDERLARRRRHWIPRVTFLAPGGE